MLTDQRREEVQNLGSILIAVSDLRTKVLSRLEEKFSKEECQELSEKVVEDFILLQQPIVRRIQYVNGLRE
jgi:hypothetical protein